jgi:rubrerythrin
LKKLTTSHGRPTAEEVDPAEAKDISEILESARCLENRAVRYYTDAAAKLKALSEVSQALKTIGKKHTTHLKKLDTL